MKATDWTPTDDWALVTLRAFRCSWAYIGERLGRTPMACYMRLYNVQSGAAEPVDPSPLVPISKNRT